MPFWGQHDLDSPEIAMDVGAAKVCGGLSKLGIKRLQSELSS